MANQKDWGALDQKHGGSSLPVAEQSGPIEASQRDFQQSVEDVERALTELSQTVSTMQTALGDRAAKSSDDLQQAQGLLGSLGAEAQMAARRRATNFSKLAEEVKKGIAHTPNSAVFSR